MFVIQLHTIVKGNKLHLHVGRVQFLKYFVNKVKVLERQHLEKGPFYTVQSEAKLSNILFSQTYLCDFFLRTIVTFQSVRRIIQCKNTLESVHFR